MRSESARVEFGDEPCERRTSDVGDHEVELFQHMAESLGDFAVDVGAIQDRRECQPASEDAIDHAVENIDIDAFFSIDHRESVPFAHYEKRTPPGAVSPEISEECGRGSGEHARFVTKTVTP